MKIPANRTWTNIQDSDVYGSLNGSFGLDLNTNKGSTRLWPRMVVGTDDITDLGVPVGFERFNSGGAGFWTVAGGYVFKSASVDASAVFVKDAQSGTPNNVCSSDTADIRFFRSANKLVVTSENDIYYNSGSSAWSDVTGTPLTGGSVHMMTEFDEHMYITEEMKKIWSVDTSMTLATTGTRTFKLDTYTSSNIGLFITTIERTSDKIWIFTVNGAVGQVGRVFTWDGVTQDTPDTEEGYILDSAGVMAAVIIADVPFIINTEGRFQNFNGGTFVDLPNGKLPIRNDKYLKNTISTINNRWIHPKNGLIVVPGNKVRAFINNVYEDGTIEENMPSGIWEYDLGNPNLGWVHIVSPSLYTSSVTDYGQNRISRVGGMLYAKTPTGQGLHLIGAQLYSDATNTKEIIATENTSDTIQKYGYFVTSKIFSQNITDTFQSYIARFKKLVSGESITVKYRSEDVDPVEITLTWTGLDGSGNSIFQTSEDLSNKIGYEVEITQGTGGGKCAHIVSVSPLGSSFEVVLDDVFTGANGTAIGRVQNWVNAGKVTDINVSHIKFPLTKNGTALNSTFVQFKVCMQFTGKGEFYDGELINSTHIKSQ